MTIIRETLERDLSQKIEEIIKLDQQDEGVVYQEITEYVPTPDIQKSYRALLDAISTSRNNPDEAVGVWISGFFGSGKSSFAKNLGYMLANKPVLGTPAGRASGKAARRPPHRRSDQLHQHRHADRGHHVRRDARRRNQACWSRADR